MSAFWCLKQLSLILINLLVCQKAQHFYYQPFGWLKELSSILINLLLAWYGLQCHCATSMVNLPLMLPLGIFVLKHCIAAITTTEKPYRLVDFLHV